MVRLASSKALNLYCWSRDGQCELFVEVQEIARWQPEALLLQQQAQAELELWPERGRQCPNCRQLNVKVRYEILWDDLSGFIHS